MRLSDAVWIPFLVGALCLPTAATAEQQGEGNQAGQPSSSGTAAQAPEEAQAPPTTTDARSFLGVEEFTPGQVGEMRSYFLPSFQVSERADSNFRVGPGPQRFESVTALVGRLASGKIGKHSQLTADYSGGGLIYNRHSELNTSMHQFGITQSYQGRRWSLLLDDRATYLPESSFGYGGFGWMGAPGPGLGGGFSSNLSSLNPYFNPAGDLFTSRGSRIMNTTAAQVKYLAGPRSAITIAGSYGLLHFREPGLTDSRNAFFLAGYSRSLTPRDYLGLDYGFGWFQFKSSIPTFQTHLLQLNYGHRITGRLATNVGAGTQVNVFKDPLAGSKTPLSWSAHASLNYRVRRGSLALYYSRYTSSGAGVLTGATTDNIRVSWGMGLTRNWRGSLAPGYSHNRSLPQTTSSSTRTTFDAAYVSASLSRSLGPYMSMFFMYNFQTQRSESVPCLSGSCGESLLRHLVGFGFSFHPRRIMID
jgi:hypothetical protein